MCTGFVVHANQTIIGMNVDISQRPIKLALIDEQLFLKRMKVVQTFLSFQNKVFYFLSLSGRTEFARHKKEIAGKLVLG